MKLKIRNAASATLDGKTLRAEGNIRLTKNAREIVIEGLPDNGGSGGIGIVNNFSSGGDRIFVAKGGIGVQSGGNNHNVFTFGNVGHIVNLSGSGNVVVGSGNAKYSVGTVYGPIGNNSTMFMNNNCIIGSQQANGGSNKNKKAKHVTVNETIDGTINEIQVSGASSLSISGKAPLAYRVEINVSGASDVNLDNITLNKLHAHISGSSSLTGPFTAADANVHVSGCSSCTNMHITGDGDIEASGCSKIRASCADVKRVSKTSNGLSTIALAAKTPRAEPASATVEAPTVKSPSSDSSTSTETSDMSETDESSDDVIVVQEVKKRKTK